MKEITITLTDPAATRVRKALQRVRSFESPATLEDVKDYIKFGMAQGADFFNTAITLNGTSRQIDMIIDLATRLGYVADKVTDPSYPYFIDR